MEESERNYKKWYSFYKELDALNNKFIVCTPEEESGILESIEKIGKEIKDTGLLAKLGGESDIAYAKQILLKYNVPEKYYN